MESLKGMKNSTVQRLTFMSQLDGIFACPDAWFKIIALFTLFLWGYCWVRIITLKSVSWEKQLIFSNVGGPHLIGWRFAESSKFVIYWSQAELSLPDPSSGLKHWFLFHVIANGYIILQTGTAPLALLSLLPVRVPWRSLGLTRFCRCLSQSIAISPICHLPFATCLSISYL